MARFAYGLLVLFISVCVYVSTTRAGLSPDLPSPPTNIKPIVAGSLVMPMDNKQLINSNFNIKTYGLAVHLLYNEIPLYWSIRAGKAKDAKDFSATAQQVYPTTGSQANFDYFAGPFIILKAYQTKALNVISQWQSGTHGVIIHKILADTTADIRHQIFVKPKILISNLSGYSSTQINILTAAGLVKDTHFIVTDTGGAISALNPASCYTFFSEPHYLWDNSAPGYYSSIGTFVGSGGNFLAECAGAYSYENYNPGSGRGGFQSIAGLYQGNTQNLKLLYPNPDVPYNQFMGDLNGANDGYLPDYCFYPPSNLGTTQIGAGVEQTWLINNAYYAVVNDPAAIKCTNGQTNVIASVSKPGQGQGIGGLVYYLGAHNWSPTSTKGDLDAGKRLYLNALITPTTRDKSCGFNFCPPGQECPHDDCHTCTCSNAGEAVLTAIPGCCLATSDCAPCQSCLNKACVSNCQSGAVCAQCVGNQCQPKPCPCTTDSDCLPCYGCDLTTSPGQCLKLSEACCTQDSDCGACGYCDTLHPITPSRSTSTKPFYICQSIPNCCTADANCTAGCQSCDTSVKRCKSDCTPCQTCNSGTGACTDVSNCCLINSQCGTCKVCDLTSSQCTDCPTCTACNGTDCAPVPGCCQLDDECAACETCQNNACVSSVTGDLGSCCASNDDCQAAGTVCAPFGGGFTCELSCTKDSDCADCQTCVAGACQTSAGCGDGDGDGGSDASRATFGLKEIF